MDHTTLENPTTATSMPSRKWFAELPNTRRDAALRGTGAWKIANDPKKHGTHLAPHRCQSAQPPVGLESTDAPIREMLEAVHIELHEALLTVAKATMDAQLFRMMKALRQFCPAQYEAQMEKRRPLEPYVDGHLLSDEADRQNLWNAAMAQSLPTDHVETLRSVWKQVVRSEYLVSRLSVHIRSDY